jgi:hypothetical protein
MGYWSKIRRALKSEARLFLFVPEFFRSLFSPCGSTKSAVAIHYCEKLSMRNFLLVGENRFLVRENRLLIGKNLIQGSLVLEDYRLVVKQRFLIFENGGLVAEDRFLIRENFLF